MSFAPTRRRFIGISAAACGLALLRSGAAPTPRAVVWRGRTLGAPAEIIIHHPDRVTAERLIARAVAEIEALENIFSLYRADSALCTLNRFGALATPPAELVEVLHLCRNVWQVSNGAFDPTVQPLWQLYAGHFAQPDCDPAGPHRTKVSAARRLIGFDRVAVDRARIAFARRGMALTLNGVAQGYITDRIVGMLCEGGVGNTLVDLGEIRALGRRDESTLWRARIAGARDGVITLENRALATSSAQGFRFAGPETPGHIIDPRIGGGATFHESVSVVAGTAATADALSTAFTLMSVEEISAILAGMDGVEAFVLHPGGHLESCVFA